MNSQTPKGAITFFQLFNVHIQCYHPESPPTPGAQDDLGSFTFPLVQSSIKENPERVLIWSKGSWGNICLCHHPSWGRERDKETHVGESHHLAISPASSPLCL